MNKDIYVMDVLKSVVAAMQVQIYGKSVGTYHKINFEPGRDEQIFRALIDKDGTSLQGEKYPLIAVRSFTQSFGTGFNVVRFDSIVFADMIKTDQLDEKVLDKHLLSGIYPTVLYPCLKEFIKRLAWSTSTSLGDPDAYAYSLRELPGIQLSKDQKGTSEIVDILEITNLEAIIFPQIKTC